MMTSTRARRRAVTPTRERPSERATDVVVRLLVLVLVDRSIDRDRRRPRVLSFIHQAASVHARGDSTRASGANARETDVVVVLASTRDRVLRRASFSPVGARVDRGDGDGGRDHGVGRGVF